MLLITLVLKPSDFFTAESQNILVLSSPNYAAANTLTVCNGIPHRIIRFRAVRFADEFRNLTRHVSFILTTSTRLLYELFPEIEDCFIT